VHLMQENLQEELVWTQTDSATLSTTESKWLEEQIVLHEVSIM